MNFDYRKKNELITKIISKVSVRHNLWIRKDPDYKNRGLRTRSFRDISEEIRDEMGITILGTR